MHPFISNYMKPFTSYVALGHTSQQSLTCTRANGTCHTILDHLGDPQTL